ncbi:MAG: hypothetical protein ACLFP1_07825 [Candidatus Goldiibacteriota bacterium]
MNEPEKHPRDIKAETPNICIKTPGYRRTGAKKINDRHGGDGKALF